NLIPTVNSDQDEGDPVLSADGCELYFASRPIGGTYHLFRTQVVNERPHREPSTAIDRPAADTSVPVEPRVGIVRRARNIRARRETYGQRTGLELHVSAAAGRSFCQRRYDEDRSWYSREVRLCIGIRTRGGNRAHDDAGRSRTAGRRAGAVPARRRVPSASA